MAATAHRPILFAPRIADAYLACLIKQYRNFNKDLSSSHLGTAMLQRLCYFAKASGIPLPFRFEICHYGPFSQEIIDRTEDLLLEEVIRDFSSDQRQPNYAPGAKLDEFLSNFTDAIKPYETNTITVARMFSQLDPSQKEIASTIHYMHSSYSEWFKKIPSKESVIASVLQAKEGKVDRLSVEGAYDILRDTGLISMSHERQKQRGALA